MVPFAAAFGYSLLYSFGIIGVVNDGFTLEFWAEVFRSGAFLDALIYSVTIALISVFISVTAALWFTLKFQKKLRGKIVSFMIYLPLAIPGIVAAFFTVQILSKSGLFSRFSYLLGFTSGITDFPDLINDQYAIGIILVLISVVMPFFVLLFLNVYDNERLDQLTELARSLGASNSQTIWRVSLPVILRKTWTLIALYFIFLLGAYEVPLILGQESPQMLSVLIVRELKQFDLTKISEGYVVAVMYTILVSIATILLFSKRSTENG